ncbi:MAG: transposase [Lachnospira sp.]
MINISRKHRIWYPNAIYHIVDRGIHRQEIFQEPADYFHYLEILKNVQEIYPFEIHAFCLMPNHIHMLIGTQEDPIWDIMKRQIQLYTQYFNFAHSYSGHLFEGRYKSFLIQDDNYFLQTGRYIHLNPVKANIVVRPENYRYSSFRTYMGYKRNKIICTSKTLSYFGMDNNLYQKYLHSSTDDEEKEFMEKYKR